jgi:hypothetical protein
MPKGQPDKGYALTPQREEVLHILATEGPIDDVNGLLVGRLAERLGYGVTQTLSMVIKRLESVGLIKRDVTGAPHLPSGDRGRSCRDGGPGSARVRQVRGRRGGTHRLASLVCQPAAALFLN